MSSVTLVPPALRASVSPWAGHKVKEAPNQKDHETEGRRNK